MLIIIIILLGVGFSFNLYNLPLDEKFKKNNYTYKFNNPLEHDFNNNDKIIVIIIHLIIIHLIILEIEILIILLMII